MELKRITVNDQAKKLETKLTELYTEVDASVAEARAIAKAAKEGGVANIEIYEEMLDRRLTFYAPLASLSPDPSLLCAEKSDSPGLVTIRAVLAAIDVAITKKGASEEWAQGLNDALSAAGDLDDYVCAVLLVFGLSVGAWSETPSLEDAKSSLQLLMHNRVANLLVQQAVDAATKSRQPMPLQTLSDCSSAFDPAFIASFVSKLTDENIV